MKRRVWARLFWFIATVAAAGFAGAASASDYTLFNPTPASQLRDFNTDRPSITEGPFTIDPGHVQTETDIVNYSRSRPDNDGTVGEKYLYGSTNLRLGVTSDLELDFLLQPYDVVRTITLDPAGRSRSAGVDTFQLRAKYNFYGNDTYKNPGDTALGLIPFVNIPTAHNGVSQQNVDGGLILPFAWKLSDKYDFSAMTEVDYVKNDLSNGYHFEYVNSGGVSYQINDKLSTYVEIASVLGIEANAAAAITVGGGFLYKLADNLQIDVAANFGLTRSADRINLLTGISRRY